MCYCDKVIFSRERSPKTGVRFDFEGGGMFTVVLKCVSVFVVSGYGCRDDMGDSGPPVRRQWRAVRVQRAASGSFGSASRLVVPGASVGLPERVVVVRPGRAGRAGRAGGTRAPQRPQAAPPRTALICGGDIALPEARAARRPAQRRQRDW